MNIYLPGVIENIITAIYSVDMRYVYRQLNKQIYRETACQYYEYHQDKIISKQERLYYYESKPDKWGLMYIACANDSIYISVLYLNLLPFQNIYQSTKNSLCFLQTGNVQNTVTNLHVPINHYDYLPVENFDLLTAYQIYNSRKSMTIVNKNYAIESTLALFEKYAYDTFFRIYTYYQYVMLNCFVLGIDCHYHLLPSIRFHARDFSPTMIIFPFLNEIFDNPVDITLYHDEKHRMLNEIHQLKPKIIEKIKYIDQLNKI